jgi:hypothetical protein
MTILRHSTGSHRAAVAKQGGRLLTNDELRAERAALKKEHAELLAEHRVLQQNRDDGPGHVEHARKLRLHLVRLGAFTEALWQRWDKGGTPTHTTGRKRA